MLLDVEIFAEFI